MASYHFLAMPWQCSLRPSKNFDQRLDLIVDLLLGVLVLALWADLQGVISMFDLGRSLGLVTRFTLAHGILQRKLNVI